jgi:NAD(P)-dependent dehydrogenase (short-subunit alcohol dehydrogenase family)
MPTVLVTGANRGIGLSLARIYADRGDRVIGTSRGPAPELEAAGARVERLDVAAAGSVDALDQALGDTRIDLLLHNAGVLGQERLDQLDLDSIRHQFEVNALGPLRLTAALRHRLAPGATVAIVTSRMGSMTDNTSGGAYGYRMSKAAVNMAGRSLTHDLASDGVAVVLLHPGWVKTGMTGGRGNWGPDEAAAGLVARIDETSPDNSGRFVHADGTPLPW